MAASAAIKNYLVRHWRGDLSLTLSFLNTVLIGSSILMARSGILSLVWRTTGSYVAAYHISVISFILLMLVELWALVGLARAGRGLWMRGKKALPILAACVCVLVGTAEAGVATFDLEMSYRIYRWYKSDARVLPPPDPWYFFDFLFFKRPFVLTAKPVIYLYPKHEQHISVKLHYQGRLTTSYPAYDAAISGWTVTAYPDGHLVNHADNETYSYLFWEGAPKKTNYDLSTGFVVAGKDTAAFLQKRLEELGLTPQEYNEFIVYWLPKMQDNPYNLIHFAGEDYTKTAPLDIAPKPDSLLRVFMVFKALQKPIDIPEQKIQPFERRGFAVIEWGGTEIR